MALSISRWSAHAPLHELTLDWARDAGIELAVLRLDLLDPLISGNKWFKLLDHLSLAQARGAQGVISLGGAHSNHLHAVAAAGQRFGFATVGLLRGHAQVTPTVEDLQSMGMQLHWLGYGGYRERHLPSFWQPWLEQYADFYPLPEGGGGLLGARGCAHITSLIRTQLSALGWPDYHGCWLACGTGTSLAGLVLAEAQADVAAHPVYGVSAVPVSHGVSSHVERILADAERSASGYQLYDGSRGGFAKVDPELLTFMHDCEAQSGVPLEPLYTAKALMTLQACIRRGDFKPATRLVFIHTGGLQGRRALLPSG